MRITSTLGSLIKSYYIILKNWSQQNQQQQENRIQISEKKEEITNEETSVKMTSETIIVEAVNDQQTQSIEDTQNQQSLTNDNRETNENNGLLDELSDFKLEKNVQINYVESLKLDLIQELTDYYEQIKVDVKTRAEYEKSRFHPNILNDDKRDNIDSICEKLNRKVDELIRRTSIDLNSYFQSWLNNLNDSTLNSLKRESIKMKALKCFAVFISNDSLLSELAKNYPVGILCYSDYYLSAYQQAFLRLVFYFILSFFSSNHIQQSSSF